MTHDEIKNQLDAYADGEVSTAHSREIAAHLQACASCRLQHDEWLRIKTAFLKPSPELPSESFIFKVMENIREQNEPFNLFELIRWALPTFAVMAAALFFIGAVPFESDQAFALETALTKGGSPFSLQEFSEAPKDAETDWMGLEVL